MAEIKKLFASHRPSSEGVEKLKRVRLAFSQLIDVLEAECPMSRERSVAVTHLESASMWAVKAITHNDPNAVVVTE